MLLGLQHMSTADSVSRLPTAKIDHLRNAGAVNSPWRSGANNDPIKAQNVTCESIYKLLKSEEPSAGQLEALIILDRQAQQISDQLLNLYVEGGNEWRRFERSFWISAMRLSQSFFSAYEHFLRHIRNTAEVSLLETAHSVVVQLFHHRQTEFLLRFIRFKKRIPGQWKELHEIYRFAIARGIATHRIATGPADYTQGVPITPEQQYIRLLLLELMNNGHFSPREALWADRWFSRWCSALHLQAYEADTRNEIEQTCFVVDLDSVDGLDWAASPSGGSLLFLDPSPLMAMIDEELGLLRNSDSLRGTLASAGHAGKLALLAKLKPVFDPKLVRTARHDDRTPVDLAVQTIFSAPNIIQVLYREAMASTKGMPLEGITISPLGQEPYRSSFAVGNGSSPASISITENFGVVPEVWQLRDRSDSGSRLRGQIDDLNRIIPGSLIAFREGENAPWTVSVVRRFRRLMVDHVEIGVEHIGRRPRFVKLVAACSRRSDAERTADAAQKCFAALYLPPSERWPTMPIKTLLLPECNFQVDSTVTLLSSNATYTLRLNKPLQQQFEFIWTSFTVVDKTDVSSNETSTEATN